MTDHRMPPEWRAAVDGGDFNTLAALADWLQERGRNSDAECCRWAVAKRRWPTRGRYVGYGGGDGLRWYVGGAGSVLPRWLLRCLPRFEGRDGSPSDAFERLWEAWAESDAGDRWSWQPPAK